MDEWVDSMKRTLLAVQQFGGETEPLVIAPPASEEEIAAVEAKLGTAVPASFRKVLTEFSASVDLRWELPDLTGLPKELRRIGSGLLWWNIHTIVQMYDDYQRWVDNVFTDIADPYDKVWHNKFPVLEDGTGDFIAISVEADQNGSVVYLSHDGDSFHGCRLADDFADFLDRYLNLHCAGPDFWTLETFISDPADGLQTDCPNAQLWQSCLLNGFPPSHESLEAFRSHQERLRNQTERDRALDRLDSCTDPSTILGIYAAHPDLAVEVGIDEIYRLLAADTSGSGQYACTALGAFRDPSVLDWIEENVPTLVTTDWGALAAVSSFTWSRATAWLRSGRPLSLVALDALKESAKTGTFEWPPYNEVELTLSAYLASDSAPRVKQAINAILGSLRNSGLR